MKLLRTVLLMVAFGLLVANPSFGFETQCCSEFQQHCDDWCSFNDHGTGLITQCGQPACTELCFCTGLCGGQHCTHEDPGGTRCPACSER